ncbi:SPOR domain-containing protein [Halomonas sp. NO4]|uniref:SPOR domain-containing protein n=1 Tax=Halomonas sp. NO4 TaxID=2484813 RepID=UPI0013D80F30|nr:SPOR domain-containing protein [Halomonas sp. NO4]
MKYGMRERISGAVILIALAVIFVPMLFDDPAPRQERPEPVLTIEQPVPVERQEVPAPQPPASLGEIASPESPTGDTETPPRPAEEEEAPAPTDSAASSPDGEVVVPDEAVTAADEADAATAEEEATSPSERSAESAPAEDPIAELARAANERMGAEDAAPADPSPGSATEGEWAVQVGSFGEPGNAERLQVRLEEQGYAAYRRVRDNDLTTVYVGPFASSEEGERVMDELKREANLQGLLVRVRQ